MKSEIDPFGEALKELDEWETIIKETQKIKIRTTKRRYGKMVTVIEGLDKNLDLKSILKELKSKLACGGTIKEDTIELQGDHKKRAKEILIKLGFPESGIEIE